MRGLRQLLASAGIGVSFLPVWLAVLCLTFGAAGILWFMCTWIPVAVMGAVLGWVVVPGLDAPS